MDKLETGEMHWSDGWTFKRLEGGAVRVRKFLDSGVIEEAVIPAAEWVSIIQHVGAEQSAPAFALASALHNGIRIA